VDLRGEDGTALLIALMAMLLMTALGIALVLTTSSETIIASHFRNSREGLYAADAVLERSLDDLLTVADWNQLLNGSVQSTFVDGPPSGSRVLADGSLIDLVEVLALATCQKTATCSSGDMDAVTNERPWGANNPRWQLYAYGNLRDIMPSGTVNSPYYVVAMVGDDPSENDGNPLQDGASEDNPGSGVLAMRAEAFGPNGAHKVIEATVARPDESESGIAPAGVRILSWREMR
jgi:hypothetical protein